MRNKKKEENNNFFSFNTSFSDIPDKKIQYEFTDKYEELFFRKVLSYFFKELETKQLKGFWKRKWYGKIKNISSAATFFNSKSLYILILCYYIHLALFILLATLMLFFLGTKAPLIRKIFCVFLGPMVCLCMIFCTIRIFFLLGELGVP